MPGDLVLHPLVLGALVVMAVNDHWGKPRFPSAATGKLSDVAGVFALPLVLVSLWELGRRGLGWRPWQAGDRALAAAVVATGAGFAAMKLLPSVGAVYVGTVGGLRWSALAAVRLLSGDPGWPAFPDIQLVPDPTDLLVLPVLALAWWIGHQRQLVVAEGPSVRSQRPSIVLRGRSTWLVP